MTDIVNPVMERAGSEERANYREPRVGQWYYAGLCVSCRVCGSGVGAVCRTRDGNVFHSGEYKHHYWRYRDVREYIGRQLPGVEHIDRETWLQEQAELKHSQNVTESEIAAVTSSENAA